MATGQWAGHCDFFDIELYAFICIVKCNLLSFCLSLQPSVPSSVCLCSSHSCVLTKGYKHVNISTPPSGFRVSERVSSVLSPRQHSIGYTGYGFYRSKDPTNSIKVLKGMLQKRKKTTKITKYTCTDTKGYTQNKHNKSPSLH